MEKKRPILDASTFPHFHVFEEFGSVSKEWGQKKKNANVRDYERLAWSLAWPASVAVF